MRDEYGWEEIMGLEQERVKNIHIIRPQKEEKNEDEM